MAAYDSLKSLVQQAIRTNGNNEITGQVLQNVLMAMIDELGGENGYAGVATPSTNPGAPDGKVFYFATEAGTYTHFDGATLAKGIHLLVFNGVTWSHQTLYTIDSEVTSGSNNLITSGAVYTKIINAINALDATVSKSAGADGLSLSLTETDGKVTSISGSIAPQTYDAYGAASAAQIAASTDATNKVNAAKTQILGDAASDYNTLGKLEDKIQAEASRAAAAESALNTAKANKANTLAGYGINDAYTKTEVNGLVSTPHQNYVTVPTYASLPTTGSADTIYRVSNYNGSTSQVDDSVYSEYAWNGSGYTFLRVVSQIGEVFDITVYNSNTKYADLAAALGTNGANLPSSIRRGGMSVKFVQSSDNKYVQYRYMLDGANTNSKFTNIENWQGVENKVVAGSSNLVTAEGIKNAILENCGIGVLSNFGDLSRKDNFRKSFKSLILYTNSSSFAKKQIIMSKCQHSSYVGGYIDVTFSVLENGTLTKLCRFYFGTANKDIVVIQGVELSNEITNAFLTIDCSVIYPNSGTTEADTLNTFTISTVSDDTYEKYGVENVSIINLNKDDIDDIKKDISNIQDEIDAIRGEWVDITASGIVTENEYINYLGGISSGNLFSIKTFDVQESEKYIIDTTNVGSTGIAQYAIYSGEPSSSTLISVGEMVESALHTEVTIPTNAVYLVITYRFGNQYPTSVLKFEEKKENPAYKILLRYNSTTKRIDVSRKYSADKDFIVTLKPVSVNNTVQFANFGFANDSNPYPTVLERTISYNEGTDWIGPIMFHGGSGGDASRYGFTGGWHGSNGDQTGFATARTDSVKVYADEGEVEDGLYKCDSCKIVVTNYIKSCNTIDPAVPDSGTECLKEIVTYHFVNTKIFVTVELVALVGCTIFRYYGMQISSIFSGDVLMIGDSIFKGSMGTSFNVGNTNINDIIVKKDSNTELYVDAFLDREVNLGLDSRSVTNKAFVSNNKAYYRLIGNNDTTIVSQGDSLMWRGSYEFRGAMI